MPTGRAFNQDATYWAPAGRDKYGKQTFTAPVTKKVRWEDKQEEIVDKVGEQKLSKSRVFLQEDIDIDGYLFRGVSAASTPLGLANALEIQGVGRTPNLKANKQLYVAYL